MDYRFVLALFHVLIVAPLFLSIGFIRANTPEWVYFMLLVIGFVVLVYHGYKLFLRLKTRSNYFWVNSIHALLVAPLLIFIGYNKKNTPRAAYELLIMLGFSVGGYHLYSLVNQLQAHSD
jgi:hypothetical protein